MCFADKGQQNNVDICKDAGWLEDGQCDHVWSRMYLHFKIIKRQTSFCGGAKTDMNRSCLLELAIDGVSLLQGRVL